MTLSPTPNQVVQPTVNLQVALTGGHVVPQTTSELKPDEGHVHVSLDGKVVSLYSGTTQELTGLTPGQHSVQVEFVAADHAPFTNRPVAAVLFTVAP